MSCRLEQSILAKKPITLVQKVLENTTRYHDLVPIGYSTKHPLLTVSTSNSGVDKERLKAQLDVVKEIKTNAVLLHLPTGYGKTVIGILLAVATTGRTLILVPRKIIYQQWLDRISEYAADNPLLEVRMQRTFAKKISLGEEYKCVIVDECHLNEQLVFTKILPYIRTTYLFGLSASPLSESLYYDHFFKQTVFRHQTKQFLVTPIYLRFKPRIYYTYYRGREVLHYTKILQSLTSNVERLEWIFERIKELSAGQRCLVIAKNVNTVAYLTKRLSAIATVDALFGKKDDYDQEASILVGTYQKMGVGFDSHTYKNLFLLDNLKDIIQAEGRLRNSGFHLYDFVDDHFLFISHWRNRVNWYEKRGAIVEK